MMRIPEQPASSAAAVIDSDVVVGADERCHREPDSYSAAPCARGEPEASCSAFPRSCVSQGSTSRIERASAVEKLFPPGVIAFEFRGDAGDASPDDLFPSERNAIARSVERRVREFAAGRMCARAALALLGLKPTPLLPGQDRSPIWPPGIVGSITHTDGYCVVVVGLETQFASIGVDAECIGQVSPSLWQLTMRAEELSRLQRLDEAARRRMATVIFCAKEAAFKCQYALTRSWLGFEDVIVNTAGDTFDVSVVDTRHPIRHMLIPWVGRFSVEEDLVVAGIAASVTAILGVPSRRSERRVQAAEPPG